MNQVGFEPNAAKSVALVGNNTSTTPYVFNILNDSTGAVVQTGTFSAQANWPASGENVRMADFSTLTTAGRYRVRVNGVADSAPFSISADANTDVAKLALKAFYYNRASTALTSQYAGAWPRLAGHADTSVQIHPSAVFGTNTRAAGTRVSSSKGWYDAGDYNKYIVNSGISTYTLLSAYEQFPGVVAAHTVNIPETGNGMPDLVNEALWNLDWMLTMQDLDGGVYFKLTNLGFDGRIMPNAANNTRYMVGKSTSSALNFAAVMAQASRVMANFDNQRPGLSAQMLTAARSAYAWAKANPNRAFTNPSDVSTGEYGDNTFSDEFAWAAAELFITTNENTYLNDINFNNLNASVPYWGNSWGLALMSLSTHSSKLSSSNKTIVENKLTTLANSLSSTWQNSAIRVGINASDFNWGSNSEVLNRGMMLLQAYRINNNRNYLNAAQSSLDYVLGRNGLNMSFVTGLGTRSPLKPHHRPSDADGVTAPVPGWLIGGPHGNTPDGCAYTSTAVAKRYVDDWCSYSTNEVAINWNAPLVYMGFALKALTPATP
jgi:endoglucanase